MDKKFLPVTREEMLERRIMGVLDRKGTLERGKDADIIVLDRDLNVRAVWAMGELVEGTNKLF